MDNGQKEKTMKKIIAILIALLGMSLLTACAAKNGPEQSFGEFVNGKQTSRLSAAQHEQVADGLLRRGNHEMAFVHYNKSLLQDAENQDVRVKKADILVLKGLDEQALAELSTALEANPDHAIANASAGTVYFRAGLYKEARTHLEKAIRLNPMLWKAHNYLGILNNRDGDYERAAKDFDTAIELHRGGNSAPIYNNLGVVHIARKQYGLAVDAFRSALKNGGVTSRTYNNLGLALTHLNRLDEALESFKYAGGEAKANNNLGYVLLTSDQPGKAVPYFERAIELSPSFYVKAADNLKRARLAARFQKTAAKQQSGSTPNPLHRKSFPDTVQNPGEPAASPASAGSPSGDIRKISHVTEFGEQISTNSFGLHVSSFRNHDRAFNQCAKLREKGYETWINQVYLDEKGLWYRVLVGEYATIADAQAGRPEILSALELQRAPVHRRVLPRADGSHL